MPSREQLLQEIRELDRGIEGLLALRYEMEENRRYAGRMFGLAGLRFHLRNGEIRRQIESLRLRRRMVLNCLGQWDRDAARRSARRERALPYRVSNGR